MPCPRSRNPGGDAFAIAEAMKTTAVLFVLAAIVVVLLTTVRTPCLSARRRLLGVSALAFLCAQFGLALLAARIGVHGPSSLAGVFAGALTPTDTGPVVAILGSSYSSRGLDGKLLERLLTRQGMTVRVAQLSYPGAYAYEQDYLFERHLRSGATPPAVVLLELGSEMHIAQRPEERYQPAVLAYRDLDRTAAMLWRVWVNTEGAAAGARMATALDLVLHGLSHYAHLGFLHSAVFGQPRVLDGFLPEQAVAGAPTPAAIAEQFNQSHDPGFDRAASDFRAGQATAWRRLGVRDVIFFQPPMADPRRRAEVNGLCGALAPYCIAADTRLLSALNGPYWTDLGHLNSEGAERWTHWLAEALAADARIRHALY